LILHISSAYFFSLCPIGRVVWNEVSTGSSVAERIVPLLAVLGIDRLQLENDLREFIGNLVNAGLIVFAPTIPSDGTRSATVPALPLEVVYSKPVLHCLGHVREFTSQPFRPDQL
jgi:Coenzyme PQQ synthesis protein D (PqqD)